MQLAMRSSLSALSIATMMVRRTAASCATSSTLSYCRSSLHNINRANAHNRLMISSFSTTTTTSSSSSTSAPSSDATPSASPSSTADPAHADAPADPSAGPLPAESTSTEAAVVDGPPTADESSSSSAVPPPPPRPMPPIVPLTSNQRIEKDMAFCLNKIKLHDNDQYLCSLLLPAKARAGVHVLRAFNLELSSVLTRSTVQTVGDCNPQDTFGSAARRDAEADERLRLMLPHDLNDYDRNSLQVGYIRLQWWRDGLDKALKAADNLLLTQDMPDAVKTKTGAIAAGPQMAPSVRVHQPVVAAHTSPILNMLAIVMRQYNMSEDRITSMIGARELSLGGGQPKDLAIHTHYAENTSTQLIKLTLECVGVRNDEYADRAASHIGRAMGIVLMLRSIPYAASKKQILIPRNLVEKHEIDLGPVIAGQNTRELSDCVFDLSVLAKEHLYAARQMMDDIPKAARPALMSAILVDLFLDRLELVQFNLFDPALGLLPTRVRGAADVEATIQGGVTLSGSGKGLQPARLRWELLKARVMGRF